MERERRGRSGSDSAGGGGGGRAPGKRTLTEARYGLGPRPVAPRSDDDAAPRPTAVPRPGAPLPDGLRDRFAASLGTELGDVRVHTGDDAAEEADGLDARAFAEGNDIVLGAGEDPGTPEGAWLLAHEVAHTVQQRGGEPEVARRGRSSEPGDGVEDAADRAADAMVHGLPAPSLAAAPHGPYRIPRHATLDNDRFGLATDQRPADFPANFNANSDHWRVERTLHENIPNPSGGAEIGGELTVSRFYLNGRAAALPRDAAGQIALEPSRLGGDVGAMPQFIENHPAIARMWGLRLLHNADGLVTHVVLPTPQTIATLRRGMLGGAEADLAPAVAPAAAGLLDGQQFAQAMRSGAPPLSVVDGDLYYHDWLQHMPGFLTLGRQTTQFLNLVGSMVRQLYGIANRHATGGSAALVTALRRAVDAIATNGVLVESEVTYIGTQMARPTAQIDRAELTRHYRNLWGDHALTIEPATADRAHLTPAEQANFDAAIAEIRARRVEVINAASPLLAGREAAIAQDIQGALAAMAHGDRIAADSTLHVAGRDLSLLDERGLEQQLEELAHANQLAQAQTEARTQLTAMQAQVGRGQTQAAAVAQYGSDANGAAVMSEPDLALQQRLPLLERLVDRIERADGRFNDAARVAYLARFEQVGLRMVSGLLTRAASRRSEAETDPATAHLRGRQQRVPEAQLASADIAAAQAAVGANFVWTDASVYAALVAGSNLREHPIHRAWVEAEHARRAPPPESHTLRNVVLGSLVVVGLVTGTVLLAEAVAGAEVVAGAGAATTTTASAAFSTEGAAAVAGQVRVVLDGVRVVTGLESLAVEAGVVDVVEAVVPRAAQAVMGVP